MQEVRSMQKVKVLKGEGVHARGRGLGGRRGPCGRQRHVIENKLKGHSSWNV